MSDLSEDEGSVDSDTVPNAPDGKRIPVNNVPALNAKLKSIQLNLNWIEKLDIDVNTEKKEENEEAKAEDSSDQVENDFKREMTFYNQALAAVGKAIKKLKNFGIPTKRPNDFLAEMAKSDAHMQKVRQKLLSKQSAIERRDKIRAIREQKKQGKKVQHEIVQQRKSEKKKMLNALKKTKKGKMNADILLNEKQENNVRKFHKGKKNREVRDKMYGYGGRKKGAKYNTAESSAMKSDKKNDRFFKNKNFGKGKSRPKKQRRRR